MWPYPFLTFSRLSTNCCDRGSRDRVRRIGSVPGAVLETVRSLVEDRGLRAGSCQDHRRAGGLEGDAGLVRSNDGGTEDMSTDNEKTPDSTSFIEEMKWRGFFEQCTDEDGAGRTAGRGDRHRLHRLRPHRRQPARRQPAAHHGPGAPAAARPPAHRHRGRRHGHGGRPQRQDRAAQHAHPGAHRAEPGRHQGPAVPLHHFRRRRPADGLMLNNADWLKDYGYIEFLRDVGRHFSVNQMLARDSVKSRMETGLCPSSSSTT